MNDLERFAANPSHPLHSDALDALARRALADAEPDRPAALARANAALIAALARANASPKDSAFEAAKWSAWRNQAAANEAANDPDSNGEAALALARAVVAARDIRLAAVMPTASQWEAWQQDDF